MNRIAEFEKVSFNEFLSAWTKIFSDTTEKQVKEITPQKCSLSRARCSGCQERNRRLPLSQLR